MELEASMSTFRKLSFRDVKIDLLLFVRNVADEFDFTVLYSLEHC